MTSVPSVQLAWLTASSLRTDLVTTLAVSSVLVLVCLRAKLGNKLLCKLRCLPSHISTSVSNVFQAWLYLVDGTRIIQDGFDKSNGEPYQVLAPDGRYVFVAAPKYVKELDSAPDTVLSLQGAAKQMLQPMYTMHSFNWFEVRGTEGAGFVRALRTMLTNNLPQILPDLSAIIKSRFEELHETHPVVKGVTHSPVYPMVVKLVVLSNAVSFFGKDLAKDEAFMESALQYIEETLIGAEVVRLIPKFMAPFVGRFIGRRLKAQDVVYDTLLPVAEQRCLERDLKNLGQDVPRHADCIQWIMETSPRQKPWTPTRIVHELMAIWFGSVHAVSTTITFAIHDLCLHPEYVGPLRQELLGGGYAEFERNGQMGLPLLDSFIKESARLTPVEAQSTRRSALQPWAFSDGTSVDVGDWICTPVRAIMQDAKFYPEPMVFNGFRFADPKLLENLDAGYGSFNSLQPKPSKLTDCDNTFHVWGTGRMACPGRFYAVAVMKVILGQIIMNYDCELVDHSDKSRFFTWRSTMLPKHGTRVVFTPLRST